MENVRMDIFFDVVNRSSGKWLLVIWLFLVRDCICLYGDFEGALRKVICVIPDDV